MAINTPGLWPDWLDKDAIADIDRARQAAGLTRRQLAHQAGLAHPVVAGVLDGWTSPTLEQIRRLCAALNIPVPARYSWIRT